MFICFLLVEYRSKSKMTANSLASRILVMVKAVMRPNKIRIMKEEFCWEEQTLGLLYLKC